MACKPGERLRLAEQADGQLQIVAAPAALQRAARRGQALTKEMSPFRLSPGFPPELEQQRRELPAVDGFRNSLRKAGEERFLAHGPLLIGGLTGPVIVGDLVLVRRG